MLGRLRVATQQVFGGLTHRSLSITRIGTADPRMSNIVIHNSVVYISGQTDTTAEDSKFRAIYMMSLHTWQQSSSTHHHLLKHTSRWANPARVEQGR